MQRERRRRQGLSIRHSKGASSAVTVTRVGLMAKGAFLTTVAARDLYDGYTSSIDAYAEYQAGNHGSAALHSITVGGSFFDLGAGIKGLRKLKSLHFPTPVGKAVPVASNSVVDLMADSGQLGGKLYGTEKFAKLQRYLQRRGIFIDPARNGGFDGVNGIMTLPKNPTVLMVRHELSHMLDFRQYGKDYYKRFNSFEREEMVLDRLMNNRIWDNLNDVERNWSSLYPFSRPGGQIW